jgi:hypothetical protein
MTPSSLAIKVASAFTSDGMVAKHDTSPEVIDRKLEDRTLSHRDDTCMTIQKKKKFQYQKRTKPNLHCNLGRKDPTGAYLHFKLEWTQVVFNFYS